MMAPRKATRLAAASVDENGIDPCAQDPGRAPAPGTGNVAGPSNPIGRQLEEANPETVAQAHPTEAPETLEAPSNTQDEVQSADLALLTRIHQQRAILERERDRLKAEITQKDEKLKENDEIYKEKDEL